MNALRYLFALTASLAATTVARATSVIPPTFDELVQGSELVFRGRVTTVKSGWRGDSSRQRIFTVVTFAVERTLRGEAGPTLTLEFLGGELDDKQWIIAGWPTFAVGDRGVFFVENRRSRACPIRRLRYGKYRIAADEKTGADHVLRDDRSPLRQVADVQQPLGEPAAPLRAAPVTDGLGLPDFETLIAQRSAALPHEAVPQ